jgi:hypothetical protein
VVHRPRLTIARLAALALAAGPALAGAASLSIDGGAVVLGKTESVPITVRVDEPPGTEVLPLRLSVNVGSFSEPTRIGPGKYRTVYLPPATRYPQVALVAIWRESGPEARIDFLRLPLFGTTRIPVATKRGAKVSATLGFDTFGPVVADAKGNAAVPVAVPPEVSTAVLEIEEREGVSVKKTVPVEVPPYNRLTAALVPHAVVADGRSWVRLDVLYELGGVAVPPERIRVQPSLGTVALQGASGGRYSYRYVPPAGATASGVDFAVSVQGDAVAKATAHLSLGLPAAARVVIRPPEAKLVAGSRESAPVSLLVLDAQGMGLAEQRVRLTANGAPVGPLAHVGAGRYEAPWQPPAAYPAGGLVQFTATVERPSGGSIGGMANYQLAAAPRPASVRARFVPSPVPADGRTAALLQLDVRDVAGMPLAGAQLIPVVSDGTLSPLQERSPGRYEATYSPPDALPETDATLRVVDANGGFEQAVSVPLRLDPRRLLLGVRAGWSQSPGDAAGPRAGVEAWVPVRLGGATLALGATACYGAVERKVADAAGTLTSRSSADFLPVSLRLAYEALAGRRLSLSVGAGAIATFARFENTLAGPGQSGWGLGGVAFASGAMALGLGQAFLELSYAYAPVETDAFRLDAGGPAVMAGYRLGLF